MTHEHPKHGHRSHEHKAAPEYAEKVRSHTPRRSVAFLPIGNMGVASSRLICYENAKYLRKLGWRADTIHKGSWDNYDILVFQRRYGSRDLTRAKRARSKIVLQISETRFSLGDRGRGASAITFARQADGIVVGTRLTHDWFKRQGINSTVIPTGLDFAGLPRDVPRRLPLKICWIGSMTNEKYLDYIVQPINELWKKYDFEFRIIAAASRGGFAKPVNFIPWRLGEAERKVAECHIGVAPLATASKEFTKPPSKPILYMARGLSVVATETPPYKDLIQNGHNGFLIPGNDPEKWYRALESLLTNSTFRELIAARGTEASQPWNAPVIARKWDRFLRRL